MTRKRNRPRGKDQRQGQSKAPKIRFTDRISDHFSKKDFTDKTIENPQSFKISMGLIGGLELLRSLAKNRINIVKGYQTPESAEREGGFKRNYYLTGTACQITIENVTPKEAFQLAHEVPEFKGIGWDIDEGLVHVDTRKDPERSSWVVENGKTIELTEANRAQYLEDVV